MLIATLATLATLSTPANANDLSPLRTAEARVTILADSKGLSVYTFDNDTAGHSNCSGPCAAAWPPVEAPSGNLAAPLSVVVRDDGSRQIAFQGKPLYTFARDRQPGDILGDGLHGRWHLVKP
ncbi:MAG: hypothetical protein HY075_00665 [Deltaproteobacteria bacterium]|nr:hypothetical protein [Deltaproteobacteria bacterium]